VGTAERAGSALLRQPSTVGETGPGAGGHPASGRGMSARGWLAVPALHGRVGQGAVVSEQA
jgi:hypothetical protein